VPFRDRDERLAALERLVARRGIDDRPFWRLQRALAAMVVERRKLEPNIGLGVAAVCLDLGLRETELGPLFLALNLNSVIANAVEGAAQLAPALRELPVARQEYRGPAPRTSPRARGGDR
jgi:hypothetical protein